MPSIPDQILAIPVRPCGEQQTQQSISQIIQTFYNYVTSVTGSIFAECDVTNDGDTCPDDTYAVSNFTSLWDDVNAGPFPLPVPTRADNWMTLPLPLLATRKALIHYNYTTETWRIDYIQPTEMTVVTGILQTDNKSFSWDTLGIWALTCNETGGGDFTIDTVTTRLMRLFQGLGCDLQAKFSDVEVFSVVDDDDWETQVQFTDQVDVLYSVYQSGSDGNIYGLFKPIFVPCSDSPYAALLMYVERCGSGGGGY